MKLFCENSERLEAVNFFHEKLHCRRWLTLPKGASQYWKILVLVRNVRLCPLVICSIWGTKSLLDAKKSWNKYILYSFCCRDVFTVVSYIDDWSMFDSSHQYLTLLSYKQVAYCCLLYYLLMTHGSLRIFMCSLWDTTANGSFNSGFIQMLLLSLVLRLMGKKLLNGWRNGPFSTVCSMSFHRIKT